MASFDVSLFHKELVEIAAYQMSCAIAIVRTLTTLLDDDLTRDDFIQSHLAFVNECLGKVEEEIQFKVGDDGKKEFRLVGTTKDYFERALFEAEAIKNERAAAENNEVK